MAVTLKTQEPARLLAIFREAVTSGLVGDWTTNRQGQFTQTAQRWARQAWVTPTITQGTLCFSVVRSGPTPLHRETYAHYQAKLAETFIRYFFEHCQDITVSANATLLEAA